LKMLAAPSLETFMTMLNGTVETQCTRNRCLRFLLCEWELLFNQTKESVAV
jgi:hypothetical protein